MGSIIVYYQLMRTIQTFYNKGFVTIIFVTTFDLHSNPQERVRAAEIRVVVRGGAKKKFGIFEVSQTFKRRENLTDLPQERQEGKSKSKCCSDEAGCRCKLEVKGMRVQQ